MQVQNIAEYVIKDDIKKNYRCCLSINDICYQSAMGIYINVFLEILNSYSFYTYTYHKSYLNGTD